MRAEHSSVQAICSRLLVAIYSKESIGGNVGGQGLLGHGPALSNGVLLYVATMLSGVYVCAEGLYLPAGLRIYGGYSAVARLQPMLCLSITVVRACGEWRGEPRCTWPQTP